MIKERGRRGLMRKGREKRERRLIIPPIRARIGVIRVSSLVKDLGRSGKSLKKRKVLVSMGEKGGLVRALKLIIYVLLYSK